MIAIDVFDACALAKLLLETESCRISVGAHIPGGWNTIAGIIEDVHPEMTEQDLADLVSSTAPIIKFRRFGVYYSVKAVFRGDSLLA